MPLQWTGPKCPANRTQCYDEVDLSLCFEDSAILYGIVGLLSLLAAAQLGVAFFGNGKNGHRMSVNILHVAKLVSPEHVDAHLTHTLVFPLCENARLKD